MATKNKGSASNSVGPGGTGYGSEGYGHRGYGSRSGSKKYETRHDKRNKELASHFEEIIIRALRIVTSLLPAPYSDSAEVIDMLPHPSIGSLISLSQIPDLLSQLLRNDSVTDWSNRSTTYYSMLALLRRMADCELTLQVLVEPRWQMSKGQGIENWMWDENDIEWAMTSDRRPDRAPALYEHFKKLRKQSQAFISGASQLMDSDENSEETVMATSLCDDIIAIGDDIERAITVLGGSFSGASVGASEESQPAGKGKKRDDNVNLERIYSQACENLAFHHIPLGIPDDTAGWRYPDYNYADLLKSTQNSTRSPKDRLHLVKELAVMATSLPPGIWVRVDEVRNDCM